MINFQLKDLDKIDLAGQEPDLYVSWFYLTDGDLWLTFGNQTLYEYSKEAMDYFEIKPTPYSDYYIVRFLEDFTAIFEKIAIPIPLKFYRITESLQQFNIDALKWLDMYDSDENEHSDYYFEEYDKLISWTYERQFSSTHLVGGPLVSFFRYDDKIRIVWQTEHSLENGISLWTAKDGSIEMLYSDFIKEVKKFGQSFFAAMRKQIEMTLAKEWGDIKVDKLRLVEEHKERELKFDRNLSFLEQDPKDETNWIVIEDLYNRMVNEIK